MGGLFPNRNGLTFLTAVLAIFVFVLISFSTIFSLKADNVPLLSSDILAGANLANLSDDNPSQLSLPRSIVSRRSTPKPLRAVYMSSWVAGTPKARVDLLKRLEGTNINTLVIDIKDSSGKIVFKLNSPNLAKYRPFDNHVPDIAVLIDDLHQQGFYVIGKISVFQDNYLTRQRPDLAIKHSLSGKIWEDRKGLAWLDPSSPEVWDYIIAIAREAYAVGFDELNFDYIRFPSDGEISQMSFPRYNPTEKTKVEILEEFFVYLRQETLAMGVPISANIFGLTTTRTDDFGIGQVLERIAPHFDYLCPMIYPSHYPTGFLGYRNPALAPYPIVKLSLDSAVKRLTILGLPSEKIRPWLQDFNLGTIYTASLVKAEIEAVNDAGLDSWMMWDPTNKYTINAYRKKLAD